MIKKSVIGLITAYRWLVSPFLPPSCVFTPTCSRYAISAIECHGVLKGLWLTIKRLLRCHSFGKTESVTFDPVKSPSCISSVNLNKKIPANSTSSKRANIA